MKKFLTLITILAMGVSLVSCNGKNNNNNSDNAKPKIDVVSQYSDVNAGDWFEESVSWGVNENIITPSKPNLFGVQTPMTKAQVLLAMWKAAGSPGQVVSPKTLPDDDPNSDISVATKWAVDNGIITSSEKQNAQDTASRLDAVQYMWHLADDEIIVDASNFIDTVGIDAVAWAKENGITYGIGHDLFAPDMDCTKAHMITFLYRAK